MSSTEQGKAGFAILSMEQRPLRADGTEPKNKYVVTVRVGDVNFDVPLRTTSSNVARLPPELRNHPQAEEIKKAAVQYILDEMQAQMRRLYPERG